MPIRVMIVDDTESLRALLRAHIDAVADMEVIGEAANGVQAVSIASDTQPDAIILDVEMPVMDGIEALEGLRAAAPDAKIVVFSSRTEAATEARAFQRGGDAFFRKGETNSAEVIDHLATMFGSANGA